MSTADIQVSNETNNCLRTLYSVSIEIYSAIARFTCDSTDFLLSKSVLSRLKSIVFSSWVKSHFIQVVDFSRLDEVPSRSRVRLQWYGWLPGLPTASFKDFFGYRTLRHQVTSDPHETLRHCGARETSAPDRGKVGTLRTQDSSDETLRTHVDTVLWKCRLLILLLT